MAERSSSTASRWLIGCGAGCGILVLLAVALVVAAGYWLRGTFKGFDAAVETERALDTRFGEPARFTPLPDGTVPAERIELFLAVREATAAERAELGRLFSAMAAVPAHAKEIDAQPTGEKLRSVAGIMGSAFGLAGQIGQFFDARNRALLEGGMGMGEYTYVYVLAYHSWLGHPAGGGPTGPDAAGDGDDAGLKLAGSGVERRVHRDLVTMLGNQLAALAADADPGWRAALAAEIAALEQDPARIPWTGQLPPPIGAAFEPFRARFEGSWVAAAGPMELARNRRTGRFSIQAE